MRLRIAISLLLLLAIPTAVEAQQKIPIERADELPRRTYSLHGTGLEILEDEEQLRQLSAELLRNLESDLATFDIRDDATLGQYHALRMLLYFRRGEYEQALALVPVLRELEKKEPARLTTGLFAEAFEHARGEVGATSGAAFEAAFERAYGELWEALPYDIVEEQVESLKGQLSVISRELILGGVDGQLQEVLDRTRGQVPEGVVASLLNTAFLLDERLPLHDEMLRVLTALHTAKHRDVERVDIWAARSVTLTAADTLHPVIVAVWDSGVDPLALPVGNRFVNGAELPNGSDDDGNGHVDDIYGVGYDLVRWAKEAGTLDDPAGKITREVALLQRLTKGSTDLQAAIESPEADELRQVMAGLQRAEVQGFMEELGFYIGYSHGTHVAGIVVEGNPAARILGARMTHAYGKLPEAYTQEKARFMAQMYRETIAYFVEHGVRVVNMSWRYNSQSIEGSLAMNGVGADDAERKRLAREMFEIERSALYEAIRSAPGILFVCGSGNEDNDADFSEYIPASFELPNLLTVGAVDSAGRKAAFTTEGKSVDLYANGYEVDSVVPGGDRMKMSGTSMASPQVANLAAKLLAVDPTLTVADLVERITQAADPSVDDEDIRLLDPAGSFALVLTAPAR